MLTYAPINVKLVGEGGGGAGVRWGFDIFQKIAVKFPTTRQKCEVKYNWNFPPREMICGHKHTKIFKYPYPWDSETIQRP